MRGNTRSSTKTLMEIKKKKHVLFVDGVSDWLQIWIAASSHDVKGNKVIKKTFVFLANQLVFPKYGHIWDKITYLKLRRNQKGLFSTQKYSVINLSMHCL